MRVSTGPRGTFLNAGRGGVYYREKLSGAQSANPQSPSGSDSSAFHYVILSIVLLLVGFFAALIMGTQNGGAGMACFGAVIIVGCLPLIPVVALSRRRAATRTAREAAERAAAEDARRNGEEQRRRADAEGRAFTAATAAIATVATDDSPENLARVHDLIPEAIATRPAVVETALSALQSLFVKLFQETDPKTVAERVLAAATALRVPPIAQKTLRANIARRITWDFLSDRILSEAEESALATLFAALSLTDADAPLEFSAVRQFKRLRGVTVANLPTTESAPFKLGKEERCVGVWDAQRMETRNVRTYVVDGERTTDKEMTVVDSGRVVLTTARMLFVGKEQMTDVKLKKIIDVNIDCNSKRVDVFVDGRKIPVSLSVTEAIYFGGLVSVAAELTEFPDLKRDPFTDGYDMGRAAAKKIIDSLRQNRP